MAGEPQAMELRPRGIGDLLTGAFELYRRNFLTFLGITAVVVVPLTLVQYLLGDLVAGAVEVRAEAGEIVVTAGFWRTLAVSFLVGILGFVIFQLLTGALTRAAAGAVVGQRPDMGSSYAAAGARLGSIVLVTILTGLAVLAGFILLVIPGFIVLVHLIATIPAVVVEGRRGTEALSRSWNLVRGHGWFVFGTMLVALVIIGIIQGILTGPVTGGWFAQGLLASIASAITFPYTTALVVLVYLDLRTKKEQLDRATLARELGGAPG